KADVLDTADPGALEAIDHVAREIEHGMAAALSGREVARVRGVGRGEAVDQILADLVAALADHRPGCGGDARAHSAEPLHRLDGRLEYATERAAPAGVGGADHARLVIRKQHRSA